MNELETRKLGLSGSNLKILAAIIMLIDHIGAAILIRMYFACQQSGAAILGNKVYEFYASGGLASIYMLLREIGRLAFPIFCFMVAEGFQRTKNIKKYILRMLLFALISEIAYDITFAAKCFEFSMQNVGFTFLLGLLILFIQSKIEEKEFTNNNTKNLMIKISLITVCLLVGILIAEVTAVDYGGFGIALLDCLYLLRKNKRTRLLGAAFLVIAYSLVFNEVEIYAALSFIILSFYNGSRGAKLKYFFYIFYPAHLLILYLICILLNISGISAI